MYLLEHKDELEAMYDGFDARRDGVIEAMKASDTRLGEFDTMDALKADMAEREADYAARVETLAAAEAEVERRVAVLNNVQVEFDKIWNEEN
ncbi:MAG: hypothetical protein IID53_15225 [Proteobacteria bacterium]|nr:hypothetical protein [Pseudomonadota bacterium]